MIRKSVRPKVSQDDLSGRLAAMGLVLDRSAISRIENQERAISDVELLAVAYCLRIHVEQLFAGVLLPSLESQVAEDPGGFDAKK